ncbi:hypothetical protein CVT25_013910 [Psilocybe cyanescens]|uniref:DUF5648 domain-containing protein n=1 Tax=Psilocybe cyanescens TaxID=93625 RepID=A0A409XRP7_PSICY|nr:hypothetical protein CVT25_013910 [Psilocybe cyanescens]
MAYKRSYVSLNSLSYKLLAMNNIISKSLTMLILSFTIITGVSASGNATLETPAENTCADPSLGVTYVQAYTPYLTAHALNTRAAFATVDTQGSADAQWVFQGPDFLAWTDPQEFTVPLYRFYAEATKDYLYTTSTDSNPPSVPGFSFQTIVAYVYLTQVCGSVPLLGLWDKTNGDHFYTTSQPEHTTFLNRGPWVDTGIAGYVLPVSSGMLTDDLLFEH